jgi:phosphoglycolate phosphatase
MPDPLKSPRFAALYDLFVFDLDGTLAETREDLAGSLNFALERLGRAPHDLETVTRFIGNGVTLLIQRALGPRGTQEAADEALAIFLEHYGAHCLDRTRLYRQVDEVTAALAGSGKKLTVLTNKPTGMSVKILEGLGIAGRFARIDGGDRFPKKKPDPAGLLEALASTGTPAKRALMIGDSGVDIATARAAGVAAAGALWGFKPADFAEEPPDYLLEKMTELLGPAIRTTDGSSPRRHGEERRQK